MGGVGMGLRVAILLHDRQRRAMRRGYRIFALAKVWEAQGIRVELVWGPRACVEADVLIPHLDLTVLPEEYEKVLASHPRVVNRHVRDSSKRSVSRNLVRPGDGYEGPVIVKTDRNHGGLPEADAASWVTGLLARLAPRARAFLPRALRTRALGRAKHLDPYRYPVFPSARELLPEVYLNPHLIVERFLPEEDGEGFGVRYYSFFGERHVCIRREASGPVVRGIGATFTGTEPVPDEIVAERRRLRFDYGKFDFVLHDGVPVLLDANPTPSLPRRLDAQSARLLVENLAGGLESFAG